MTAITAAGAPSEQPIPFSRLVKIEVRKAVDTRSGFWLGLVILCLSLLILVLTAAGVFDEVTTVEILSFGFAPASVLLPFVAILLITSEFSARTALSTFVLVPNRWRVIAAKMVAIIVLSLGLLLVTYVAALVVSVISPDHVESASGVSALDALWRTAVQTVIGVIGAFGLGLLIRNTPAAIVGSILLPTFVSVPLLVVPGLEDVEPWVGQTTLSKLTEDKTLTGTDWAQIGTSSLIWLVLPIALGLWRLSRAEIK
jgi:hypothetical protein